MMHAMLIKQNGFTLPEFVVTLLILGILGAFVASRYINVTSEAQRNSTNAIAGALATASAQNYATRKQTALAASPGGVAIANCTSIGPLLTNGWPPATGYSIASSALSPDTPASCTLNGPGGTSATFTGIGVS